MTDFFAIGILGMIGLGMLILAALLDFFDNK